MNTLNADVATSGIKALAPADKGWILAVVIIIGTLQVSDYFAAVRLAEYLDRHMVLQREMIAKYMEVNAEQSRRFQEIIKALTEAAIRDGERAGRAAMDAIREQSRHPTFEE